MEVTVSDAARSFIEGRGGRLYVWFAPVGRSAFSVQRVAAEVEAAMTATGTRTLALASVPDRPLRALGGPPRESSRLLKARHVAGNRVSLFRPADSACERGLAAICGPAVVIDDVGARPLMLAALCG